MINKFIIRLTILKKKIENISLNYPLVAFKETSPKRTNRDVITWWKNKSSNVTECSKLKPMNNFFQPSSVLTNSSNLNTSN